VAGEAMERRIEGRIVMVRVSWGRWFVGSLCDSTRLK
jgi:hypothetical protein